MKVKGTLFIIIAAVIIAVIIIACSTVSIPTGHTGILISFGKAESKTLSAGLHLKAPWKTVIKMDNRIQKQTVDLACFSKDIQEVSVSYTLNYQISKTNAATIYSEIGQDYYQTVIIPNIMESVKVETAKYTAEQLIQSREDLAEKIQLSLSKRLDGYNIAVIATSVENLDFTDAFTNAVEAKQVALQNKLKAETESEQKVIEADAEAKKKKIETDAEAYATLTKAEAEAKANKLLSESITNNILKYKYYEKWNGELPKFVGSDSSFILSGDMIK